MVVHVPSRRQIAFKFSVMNIFKTRLHTKIENELLTNFLMVYIEKDLLS